MTYSEIVRRLAPHSLSPDALAEVLAIIEEIDEAAAAPLTGAERTRRWRQRRASQNVTESHHSSLSSQNVTSVTAQPLVVDAPPIASPCDQTNWHVSCAEESKKESKKEVVVVVARDPDEKSPPTDDRAWSIACEIASLCGHTDQTLWPPGWCTSRHTVQGWLDDGVDPGLMVAVVRDGLRKKRDTEPINTINYFAKPLARAHQRSQQPQIPLMSVIGGSHAETGGQREFSRARPVKGGFHAILADGMR